MSMNSQKPKGIRDSIDGIQGLVELWVYKSGVLVDYFKEKNIILFQGNAEVIRTLSTISPATTPRVITRMAIGDQGTIPSDSTVPKVPLKTATTLFHEIYRKDIDTRVLTLYSPTGFSYIGNTTVGSNVITAMSSTIGVVIGMSITGTGIPIGAVVTEIISSASVRISGPATSSNSSVTLAFVGTVNECQFITTFDAVDVPLTAFANPSQPRVNEVGLVIIDPTAGGGLVRPPVAGPNPNQSDEVLMSIRCYKSVPFEIANDVSVTIRYTIFTE